MQLSVTQTITSTENNYKGNVNFTRWKVLILQVCFRAQNKQHTKKKQIQHESQFIDTKETEEGHISTAYKDNKKYTMYTSRKKITKEMCCTLIKTQITKISFQISFECKIFFSPKHAISMLAFIPIIHCLQLMFECYFQNSYPPITEIKTDRVQFKFPTPPPSLVYFFQDQHSKNNNIQASFA